MEEGLPFGAWAPATPGHSDDVVAIDADGNIAAITHSINAVLWGKTAIVVDGITIGDPASFQQQQIGADRARRAASRSHRDGHPLPRRRTAPWLRLDGLGSPPPHLPGAARRDALRPDRG